jgi:hypothetical protein
VLKNRRSARPNDHELALRSRIMITGPELIECLKLLSDEELTEVSRIIVVGRDWKAKEVEPAAHGLRGHQQFMAGLTHDQREQCDSIRLR